MTVEQPDLDIFLEHFGVKGMRWGHRKASADSSSSPRISRKQNRQMNRAARADFNQKKVESLLAESLAKGDKVLIRTQLMGTYGTTVMTGKEFSNHLLRGGVLDVRTTEVFARQNQSGQYEQNTDLIGDYKKQNFRKK